MPLPEDPLELAVAVVNGAFGDRLAATGNGLATPLAVIGPDGPLGEDPAAWRRALPAATGRVLVLVHGLMCTERVWTYAGEGGPTDYGAGFGAAAGLTPLRVRYNTGLPIAENGRALAALLAALDGCYPVPVEELVLLGFSMGGLVIRAACRGEDGAPPPWTRRVSNCFYVGTPHLGAPLERVSRAALAVLRAVPDPVTQLLADAGALRSRGIRDLAHGEADDDPWALWERPELATPLLAGAQHHFIAGAAPGPLGPLLGDSLVPKTSSLPRGAAGTATFLPRRADGRAMVHMALAHDAAVDQCLRDRYVPPQGARSEPSPL